MDVESGSYHEECIDIPSNVWTDSSNKWICHLVYNSFIISACYLNIKMANGCKERINCMEGSLIMGTQNIMDGGP